MIDRVGVAVIGVGLMGRRHAENAARRVDGARLAAVHDAAGDVARRKRRPPAIGGADGRAAVAIALAGTASFASGRPEPVVTP